MRRRVYPKRCRLYAQDIAQFRSRLVRTVHYTLLLEGMHLMFIAHLYDIVLDWPHPAAPKYIIKSVDVDEIICIWGRGRGFAILLL